MLVLSRKQEESVFINDNVVVTVLRIRGNRVTIGVDAPSEVSVQRKEAHDKRSRRRLDVAARTVGRAAQRPR